MKELRIGIIGAGKTGEPLIRQLANFDFVNIVMVADVVEDAPGIIFADEKGIPVTKDFMDIAKLGTEVDLIIEVTGQADVKKDLRNFMQLSGNAHTVIVPELVAVLLMSMAEGELVTTYHGLQNYA